MPDTVRPDLTAQPDFTAAQGCTAFVVAAVMVTAIGSRGLILKVGHGALINPDSYMRLVRIREELAAHAPLYAVSRDGSGAGTILHWSHLLDSLLVLLAVPLVPVLGQDEAVRWAGIVSGPLAAGLLGIAVAWAGAPLSQPDWRWAAALCAAVAFPILAYALPGVIQHHVLLALVAVMCAGWAGRTVTKGAEAGWNLGAWAGLGIWLSPESAPVALMAFSATGFAWVLRPGQPNPRRAMVTLGAAFLLTVGLALGVDPPDRGYLAGDIDRLSAAYLLLAGLCWVGLGALAALDPWLSRSWTRFAAAGIIASVAGAAWLIAFPVALGGPEGVLQGADPGAFSGIVEMLPIINVRTAIELLTPGTVGLFTAIMLAIRRRSLAWGHAALCVGLLLVGAVLHRRFSTYPACAGVIAIPVVVTAMTSSLGRLPAIVGMLARAGFLLAVLFGPLLPFAWPGARAEAPHGSCDLAAAAKMLRPFSGQVVLTSINDTPEVLYRSNVLTVGSLYHRNPTGYERLRDAWRAEPGDKVPEAVLAAHVSLVLFCPGERRLTTFLGRPDGTLWDALKAGHPPPWLKPVEGGSAGGPVGGYMLYRVARPGEP